MSLRSPTEDENEDYSIATRVLPIGSFRHAGMDCRHPGPQDASGHIHVNLGSGSPCRNDETRIVMFRLRKSNGTIPPPKLEFSKEITKATKGSDVFDHKLRSCCVLRG